MKAFLKTLLKKSAVPVETIETLYHMIPDSLIYGKPYRDMLAIYRQSDHWDEHELKSYQEQRLRNLIHNAYTHVPYYRELFEGNRLEPRDINTIDDLEKIPFLTSHIVRERWKDLIATNISLFNREMAHTSGTSGPSLYFYFDKTTIPIERAQAMRHLLWLDYRNGDKIAVIKGQPLTNPKKIVKYLHGSRELRVSLVNTDDQTLDKIVRELEHFQPQFIRGWPSCLYIISRWMLRNNQSLIPPKFILTSSENLYPYMKEQIEQGFHARVIDGYGQSEFVAYALQCSHGQGYHVQMETGIMELIPYQGEFSEIVGTCLCNSAMPFIRYKTGDLAIRQEEPCPCGRKSSLLAEVVGRTSDLIFRQEGPGTRQALSQCTFYNLNEIKETQFVLEDNDTLIVKVVPRKEFSPAVKDLILREVRRCLSTSDLKIIVEEVDEIRPLTGGKRPLIIGRSPSV